MYVTCVMTIILFGLQRMIFHSSIDASLAECWYVQLFTDVDVMTTGWSIAVLRLAQRLA